MELTRPVVLTLYNPSAELKVCADASAYGLGAILLQKYGNTNWKPVAYALSHTESTYSQIEKEALAPTWSCEKFSNYIIDKSIHLETDHKLLIPLLGKPTWTVYHLVSFDLDFDCHDLITAFLMSQVNQYIPLIQNFFN